LTLPYFSLSGFQFFRILCFRLSAFPSSLAKTEEWSECGALAFFDTRRAGSLIPPEVTDCARDEGTPRGEKSLTSP
jgi:hypothetical protein